MTDFSAKRQICRQNNSKVADFQIEWRRKMAKIGQSLAKFGQIVMYLCRFFQIKGHFVSKKIIKLQEKREFFFPGRTLSR